MAATTKSIYVERIAVDAGQTPLDLPVEANTVLRAGVFGCTNAAGNVVEGATSASLVARGVIEEEVDNTGGAAGAKKAKIRPGVFGPYQNSTSADLITVAEVGTDCFIVDNQTLAKTSNSSARSKAGKVHKVTSEGVYVAIGLSPTYS